MERWVKVLLGTLFSSIGVVVFFFIYDLVMVYFRKRRHEVSEGNNSYSVKQVFRKSKKNEEERTEEEMDKLLHDEYDSSTHEVLCVCTENKKTGVGLCIFLADREIEWYSEEFPECCVAQSDEEDYKYRNVLASVAHWGSKFTMAEAVNLLCQDGDLVRGVAKGTTRQWRSFYQYEKKHSFRLFLQWYENYMCGEVANEELWEDAIVAAKNILKGQGEDAIKALPLTRWKVKRVKPTQESFHMVPHPGDITPSDENDNLEFEDEEKEGEDRKLSFADERKSVNSDRYLSISSDRTQSILSDPGYRTSAGGSRTKSLKSEGGGRRSLKSGGRQSLLSEGMGPNPDKIPEETDDVFDEKKEELLVVL